MMSIVATLAQDLGTSEPTLRRAIRLGMVRSERSSPRRLSITVGEQAYLYSHWDLLSQLRRTLRTEPSVHRAVLFGSVARGTDDASSDIDLAVELSSNGAAYGLLDLQRRLAAGVGRSVQVVDLARITARHPLRRELDRDGRPLVDRSAHT
jgi:predicted nucleotidyltransferase